MLVSNIWHVITSGALGGYTLGWPMQLPPCFLHTQQLYIPNVKMRSSQQLCLSTALFHVSPVLSVIVPEVPVVLMLSGRDGDSWGGCKDIMARLLFGAMYTEQFTWL